MVSTIQIKKIAAFGLGYSLVSLKCIISEEYSHEKNINIYKYISLEIDTLKKSYFTLFSKKLLLPSEFISKLQFINYLNGLEAIFDNKVLSNFNAEINLFYCSGSILSLKNSESIFLEEKKLKTIFLELLQNMGAEMSWSDISRICTQMQSSCFEIKQAAKYELIESIFSLVENKIDYIPIKEKSIKVYLA